MPFQDVRVFRDERFSVGVEQPSGQPYLSIPVSNGFVDYEEYYRLERAELDRFLADPRAAAEFAERCRRRELDHLLIQKPGSNRGVPI